MEQNVVNDGGGAIFFVSNDHSGSLTIDQSTLANNESKGFETQPRIVRPGEEGGPDTVTSSTIK